MWPDSHFMDALATTYLATFHKNGLHMLMYANVCLVKQNALVICRNPIYT